jgi:hypothetical protein
VCGAVTGAVSGSASSIYFRTQDRLEAKRIRSQSRLEAERISSRDQLDAAQSANNGLTFLKNEKMLTTIWSTGQTNSLMEDCVRIAHLGKVAAEESSLRDTVALNKAKDSNESSRASALFCLMRDSPDEELRAVIEQHVATYASVTTRVAELRDIETALGTECSTNVGVFRILAFRRGWASGKSAHEMYENDKHNFHVLVDKSRALERCKKNTLSADEVLMLEAQFPMCSDHAEIQACYEQETPHYNRP